MKKIGGNITQGRDSRLSWPSRLLGVATVAMAGAVLAAAPASAETMHFKVRGQEAVAAFSSIDSTGCILTSAFVAAIDADVKTSPGPGEPDSRSFVIVSRYDRCTHVELLDAFGENTALPADAFVISELESATLLATIDVVDQVSGTSFPLSLDLNWTATGETGRVRDHYQLKTPAFSVNAKFNATSREASATGTISDGSTNYTSTPADFALLNSIKAGALEIVR